MRKVSINRLNELFTATPCGRLVSFKSDDVGTIARNGYKVVRVDGRLMYVHRIIFAMENGFFPYQVDHANGDKTDNRPANLRDASNPQNMWNKRKSSLNTSGVKGVSWHRNSEKWLAQIWVHGKCINLGTHSDIELAELIVSEARRKYHGDFAHA